jgi:tetratricopeptide (TPR) repeat protein
VDVAAWLRGLGLERYAPAFLENRIEADLLPSLTVEDLKDLGVTLVGDRRRLLDAIAALGAAVPPAATPVAAPDAPAPAEAERRQLTVMFCDLVGSTALSTRFDPEDLRELIGGYHRAVAETVGRKGQVLRAQGRYEDAIVEYETALASNPNLVVASNGLGWCKLFVGSIDEVIPLMQQAIRRSRRDPQVGVWHGAIGMVHMLQSRIDEAIVWFERARSASPEKPYNHLHLAAVYALSGDLERAVMELAEARRLDGGTLYSSIAHLKAFPGPWWGALNTRSLYETAYFAGLRKAGMPEE